MFYQLTDTNNSGPTFFETKFLRDKSVCEKKVPACANSASIGRKITYLVAWPPKIHFEISNFLSRQVNRKSFF